MKIYDTFTFFNELDLLDIRLNVLDEVVDQFVLVEATRTFQNRKKPLYFNENKSRFSRFLYKIKHIIVDDMPDSTNTRVLEAYQRNAIERGLSNCRPGDKILLSDLDEIPSPEMVIKAKESDGELIAFRQRLYYYYLNFACQQLSDLPWTTMIDFKYFRKPQEMRARLISAQAKLLGGIDPLDDITLIQDGGWHFSYIGGIKSILEKLRSFADPQYNKPIYHNPKTISQAISQGQDLFGRNLNFIKVPVDDVFPGYIRNNRKRFRDLIYE